MSQLTEENWESVKALVREIAECVQTLNDLFFQARDAGVAFDAELTKCLWESCTPAQMQTRLNITDFRLVDYIDIL